MADHSSPLHFEDVPLEEARRMGRGSRMDPLLYQALKEKIQSLDHTAARMTLPEGTSPTTMKNRILRVAAEVGVPVTIRTRARRHDLLALHRRRHPAGQRGRGPAPDRAAQRHRRAVADARALPRRAG